MSTTYGKSSIALVEQGLYDTAAFEPFQFWIDSQHFQPSTRLSWCDLDRSYNSSTVLRDQPVGLDVAPIQALNIKAVLLSEAAYCWAIGVGCETDHC